MKQDISAVQLRAARALVGWSREDLARAAQTTERTVARVELGEVATRASTLAAIRRALEAAGVEFIEQNGGGPGVRLRKAGAE
jgi:predicted transcriptional regulator